MAWFKHFASGAVQGFATQYARQKEEERANKERQRAEQFRYERDRDLLADRAASEKAVERWGWENDPAKKAETERQQLLLGQAKQQQTIQGAMGAPEEQAKRQVDAQQAEVDAQQAELDYRRAQTAREAALSRRELAQAEKIEKEAAKAQENDELSTTYQEAWDAEYQRLVGVSGGQENLTARDHLKLIALARAYDKGSGDAFSKQRGYQDYLRAEAIPAIQAGRKRSEADDKDSIIDQFLGIPANGAGEARVDTPQMKAVTNAAAEGAGRAITGVGTPLVQGRASPAPVPSNGRPQVTPNRAAAQMGVLDTTGIDPTYIEEAQRRYPGVPLNQIISRIRQAQQKELGAPSATPAAAPTTIAPPTAVPAQNRPSAAPLPAAPLPRSRARPDTLGAPTTAPGPTTSASPTQLAERVLTDTTYADTVGGRPGTTREVETKRPSRLGTAPEAAKAQLEMIRLRSQLMGFGGLKAARKRAANDPNLAKMVADYDRLEKIVRENAKKKVSR
uniref:Uncharacterized protein n=1 Tax=viral metagenome TaxID=1070528 RepID=A0A6M3IZM2_9ZZZZ